MTLGTVDYGILGLVGGLVAFVSFLNGVLSGVVARFYALSVGKGDLTACRRWFTVAVSIHTVVPVLLMFFGWPLGEYAIRNWLTIPPDRIGAALWVWRFTCIGSFVTMVNVPFSAMFVAKQRFGEISLYGILSAVANVGVLYFMVTHPGEWIVRLAAWICILTILPAVAVMSRACWKFEECRIVRAHLWNVGDIRELGGFVGWMTIGGFGLLLRGSGMAVLVNKLFGPARNASLSVANTVSEHASALTGSLLSAFLPAITSACGSGDIRRMAELSNAMCKFCVLALLPFVIPLALEIDEVMILWLKVPPEGAQSLCVWILASVVIDRMTSGLWAALEASGRVAVWQIAGCAIKIGGLLVAGGLAVFGCGLDAVGMALAIVAALDGLSHLILTRRYLGFPVRAWLTRMACPICAAAAVSAVVGGLSRLWLAQSFLRVCVTTVAADVVLALMGWFLVLDAVDRKTLRNLLRR